MEFTVHGWSTGPVADWTLDSALFGNLGPTVTFTDATMNNGRTTKMQVQVPATATSGSTAGVFVLSAHPPDDANAWATSITVP